MAALMLQVIPSLYASYWKIAFFIYANTYEKHFVCKDYCFVDNDDRLCFLSIYRHHCILLEDIDELL